MGRLDLPDKRVDWISVEKSYLHELYDEIKRLKEEKAELERQLASVELPLAA